VQVWKRVEYGAKGSSRHAGARLCVRVKSTTVNFKKHDGTRSFTPNFPLNTLTRVSDEDHEGPCLWKGPSQPGGAVSRKGARAFAGPPADRT
jgi:hypothetical protein